jgi:transposase-like protein
MKGTVRKPTRPPRRFAATEKCRAVLLVRTEKRSASELARGMGLTWTVIGQWQEQAMTGMLSAPEPRHRTEARPSSPNLRLQPLLDHTSSLPAMEAPRLPAGRQQAPAQPREEPAGRPRSSAP